MSDLTDQEVRRQIAERAAYWLLTLQTEEPTVQLRTQFVDWLRASPLHISELLRMSQLQRDLAMFRGWAQLPALELPLPAPAEVVRLPAAVGPRPPGAVTAPRRRLALLAAGLAAVFVAGLLLVTTPGETRYRTAAGERREVTLADGSVVALAPESAVAVRFGKAERLVTLDRGDAQFKVSKDVRRPFVVRAAQTRVRAVGTQFDVDRREHGVAVRVVEGRVAVTQQPASRFRRDGGEAAAPVLSLQANEQVLISATGVMSAVRPIETGPVAAAPAADELAFENETVGEVAQRFNARNKLQIRILDERLAARRISGVFHGSDPQSFVSFIEAAAAVTVSKPDGLHISLSSRGG